MWECRPAPSGGGRRAGGGIATGRGYRAREYQSAAPFVIRKPWRARVAGTCRRRMCGRGRPAAVDRERGAFSVTPLRAIVVDDEPLARADLTAERRTLGGDVAAG